MGDFRKATVSGREYVVYNGTYYHTQTNQEVIRILDLLLTNRKQCRLYYGTNGVDDLCEYDVDGRIGRSTGIVKIPLIVKPGASGGPGIMDHHIVKICIKTGSRYETVYKHQEYRCPTLELVVNTETFGVKSPYIIRADGKDQAGFATKKRAMQYINRFVG